MRGAAAGSLGWQRGATVTGSQLSARWLRSLPSAARWPLLQPYVAEAPPQRDSAASTRSIATQACRAGWRAGRLHDHDCSYRTQSSTRSAPLDLLLQSNGSCFDSRASQRSMHSAPRHNAPTRTRVKTHCRFHIIWPHFWYHFLLKFRPNDTKSAAAWRPTPRPQNPNQRLGAALGIPARAHYSRGTAPLPNHRANDRTSTESRRSSAARQ